MQPTTRRFALGAIMVVAASCLTGRLGIAAGDLSQQDPVEIVVELGRPGGTHAFFPSKIELETGKLYKLVLVNKSDAPHYFTSDEFSQRIFTRKVQVVGENRKALAESKGAIREIEVYPGQTAEWWLVPIATGRLTDLRCGIRDKDGKTHAEHGMVGEIVIR